ncbi:TetR/AcrR family transcriptional regulator [Hymenobacter sp. UYP22]|uniref:TetR/AcrR family transcriptional regulator n=1 Tax=Hymenobacter sp. UYP22 TaxID=3156348 RepID=UPI003394DB77
MTHSSESDAAKRPVGRLSKAERRRQLLDTALAIIREEGADRLTLGYLATRAGVSKPIAYEHFSTRSGLLTALYKLLDEQHVQSLQQALTSSQRDLQGTATVLAAAYIRCSLDMGEEWHAVRAALAGSEEMSVVQQELLAGYVQFFQAILAPYSSLPPGALYQRCVGLVGAGEALSVLMLSGQSSELEAAATFSTLIQGGLLLPSAQS